MANSVESFSKIIVNCKTDFLSLMASVQSCKVCRRLVLVERFERNQCCWLVISLWLADQRSAQVISITIFS